MGARTPPSQTGAVCVPSGRFLTAPAGLMTASRPAGPCLPRQSNRDFAGCGVGHPAKLTSLRTSAQTPSSTSAPFSTPQHPSAPLSTPQTPSAPLTTLPHPSAPFSPPQPPSPPFSTLSTPEHPVLLTVPVCCSRPLQAAALLP